MQTSTRPRRPAERPLARHCRPPGGVGRHRRRVARRQAPGGDRARAHVLARATSRAAVAARAARSARVESSSSGCVARLTCTSRAAATLAASAERGGRPRVTSHGVGAVPRREGGERRDVGGRLGDRERDLGRAPERPAERRIAIGGAGAARPPRRRHGGRRRRAISERSPSAAAWAAIPGASSQSRETRATRRTRPDAIVVASAAADPPAGPAPASASASCSRPAGTLASVHRVVGRLTARGGGAGGRRRRGVGSTPSARSVASRSATSASRNRSSRSIRSRIVSSSRADAAAPSPPRPSRRVAREARAAARRCALRGSSSFAPPVSPDAVDWWFSSSARARRGGARGSGRSGSRSFPRAARAPSPIVR